MTEKNEVYVLNQPRHAIVSFMVVGEEFPLTKHLHDNIFRLEEISDVVFIFSDQHFPKHTRIDKNKFSSLYRACAWIDSAGDYTETIFKMFRYSEEIFQTHIGYCIMNSWDISGKDILKTTLDNIIKSTSADITKPIFENRRLEAEELWKIYSKEDPKVKEESFFGRFFTKEESTKDNDLSNMYCTFTSQSDIMFLKKSLVNVLLGFYGEYDGLRFVKTFSENSDCRYMLASMINYLGIDIINCSIGDLKLGEYEEV